MLRIIIILSVFLSNLCQAKEFEVSTTDQLLQALKTANSNAESDDISVLPGVYKLNERLAFVEAHTVLRGSTSNPDDVVFIGRGMRQSQQHEILFDVMADHITLTGFTAKESANHIIQVRGEKRVAHFQLTNAVLGNAYEQILKVSTDFKDNDAISRSGLVRHSQFFYSAGTGPQFYIGGIDAHSIEDWEITHNKFYGIASPEKKVAGHGVLIWNRSKNNIVSENLFRNCDRSIGFGLGDSPSQNRDGVISNNIILNTNSDHKFSDAGIILESSPGTKVLSNTIYLTGRYPNAIEYRFNASKQIKISGNQVNRRIKSRDNGHALLTNNQRL